jgi:hypothetical protein
MPAEGTPKQSILLINLNWFFLSIPSKHVSTLKRMGPVLTRGLPNKLCGFDNMLNFVEGFQDVPVEE